MGGVEKSDDQNASDVVDYGKCRKEDFQTDWYAFPKQTEDT